MVRKKHQFINQLKDGEVVNDFFAVKFKKPPRPYEGGYYFEIRLSDMTGEITAKYWGSADRKEVLDIYNSFSNGDVIHITGVVVQYRDRMEISMHTQDLLRRVSRDEYNIEDFVARCPKDVEKVKDELIGFIDSVTNPHLKALLDSFFRDETFMREFERAPAAMHYHQNYIGGLLDHTVNVAKICDVIHSIHPKMERDLLITGALLHDIGKVKEFEVTTSIDVSREGMLIGHIVLGKEMVMEKIKSLNGFPDLLALKVAHIILSHHGKNTYGSPKTPQLPEAMAVHLADEMDAKLSLMIRYREEADTEDPWVWTKMFGHIFLE